METTEYREELFKQALKSDITPSSTLNHEIKRKMEEQMQPKKSHKMILRPVLAVLMVLILSGSAYAAWQFLSPSDVAQILDDPALASAFASDDAVVINETKSQNGYDVSLLGIVSGNGLSSLNEIVDAGKTYAVVAIARQESAENGKDLLDESFFVSPLIHGEQPWRYNIASMHGGFASFTEGGVLYRLIECDNVELFADRGLSLIVSSTDFYSSEAYDYDETTGLVTPNPEFSGVNLLFDLPLDAAKADSAKAQAYLDSLWAGGDDDEAEDPVDPAVDGQELRVLENGVVERNNPRND